MIGQDEVLNLVSKGDIEALEALYKSFCATADIVYLLNAIGIVERLIAVHPSNDFLGRLLSDMSRHLVEPVTQSRAGLAALAGADAAPLTATTLPQDGEEKRTNSEQMEVAQILTETFVATGDIGYLENAIGLVQGCIAANQSPRFHTFLSGLLLMSRFSTLSDPKEVPIAEAVPRTGIGFFGVFEIVPQMLDNMQMEMTEAVAH